MSIRLLVIVNVYRPDLGGGILFSDLMEGLSDKGVQVTVRCAHPYYPEWHDKSGKNGLGIRRYTEGGVQVERFGIFIPRDPTSLSQRLLYEASFFLSLARSIHRSREYDVVMTYCPLVGGVAFGALAATVFRTPLWLNVQDLSAAAATAGGIVRRGSLSRFLESVQNLLFNRASVWSTLTPQMQDRLLERTRRNQPVFVLPNWLHRSLEEAIRANPKAVDQAPSNTVKLLYSGNLGGKQNLIEFCKVLHRSPARFEFRIRAAGSGMNALVRWLADTSDTRFRVETLSNEHQLARALQSTDLYVITERSGSGGSFIPSKLVPATVSTTPILAVSDADSPLGDEVRTHGLGPHFTWESVEDVVALIDTLPVAAAKYTRWQSNLRARSAYYDRDAIIDKYHEILESIL